MSIFETPVLRGMPVAEYRRVREAIAAAGFAEEIKWAQELRPVSDPDLFATEAVYVICNSGMRAQVARQIFDRIMLVLRRGGDATDAQFGHPGKREAINRIWRERLALFQEFQRAEDKVEWLHHGLPWIGAITKFHLARNLGIDCVKPDRHLVRLARQYGLTPTALCTELAGETGDRVGTVDCVLWRACNLGILNPEA